MAASIVAQQQAASLADSLQYYTVDVFDKFGDPRVAHHLWMRTPWPTIAATLLYYSFVRRIGPSLMKDRKPYKLLPIIRIYNLMMAVWNCFGFLIALKITKYGYETLGCTRIDPQQRDDEAMTQIYYGWMFFTSRLVEFADTVFFVLRKKDSQLTSFHVFHHSVVPTLTWFFLKFAPGGNSGIFPLLNTAVHTIMYSYYLLATFASMRQYLGWKKYLTQMQIVQFLIIIAVCMQPLFIPGCKFPRVLTVVILFFSCVFIHLFVDFYFKSYRRSRHQRQKLKQFENEEAATAANALAANNDITTATNDSIKGNEQFSAKQKLA